MGGRERGGREGERVGEGKRERQGGKKRERKKGKLKHKLSSYTLRAMYMYMFICKRTSASVPTRITYYYNNLHLFSTKVAE